MTRDNIIQVAREVGFTIKVEDVDKFERFAALVAAPLKEEIRRLRFCIPEGDAAAAMEYLAYCVEKAVAEEREACAKLCEDGPIPKESTTLTHIPTLVGCAAAIRARG